jgi:signal transduction histidine kinase
MFQQMNTDTQNQLRESLQKPILDMAGFLDSSPIAVILYGLNLSILFANRKSREWIPEASSIDRVLSLGSPAQKQTVWQEMAEMNLSGRQIPPSTSLRFTTGTTSRLLGLSWVPVRDPAGGQIVAGAVFAEDRTLESDLHQQLEQAQRLASVGKVSGKVAHELNNPLDGILRYLNLAIRVIDQGQPDKAREYLLQSRTGLMRMVQIIGEILEFSRSSGPAVESVPLDQILQEAIGTMQPSAGKVTIEVRWPDPHPLPQFRPDNLFQVFCNLIKNAFDAIEDEGQLIIEIRRADRQVEIDFHDTGSGFPEDQAEMIFQPFFTTKGVGRGTGLGLAICRDLVEKLHGRITAANNPDGGSTFTVILPAEFSGAAHP